MNGERNEPAQIDLFLLASLWLRRAGRCWVLGLLLATLGAAALGWYGGRTTETVYEAWVTVTPSLETAGEDALDAAMPHILRSGLLRRQVCAYLKVDGIPPVETSVLPNAGVYTLRVRHPDPEWSWRILEAMVECAPKVARYALGPVKLTILADSGIPEEAVPVRGMGTWLLLGGGAGAMLWALLVLLWLLCSQTVRREGELDLECLGTLSRRDGKTVLRQLALRLEKLPESRRILLIAGAMPGEGATFLARELTEELSRRGRRVLLLDCDRYARHGEAAPAQRVDLDLRDPEQKRQLRQLLADARREYDHVLLDAPPCALTVDGAELSDLADLGLLTVRRDHAGRHQLRETLELLTGSGMELLGFVFRI